MVGPPVSLPGASLRLTAALFQRKRKSGAEPCRDVAKETGCSLDAALGKLLSVQAWSGVADPRTLLHVLHAC